VKLKKLFQLGKSREIEWLYTHLNDERRAKEVYAEWYAQESRKNIELISIVNRLTRRNNL
jgi:hypothetical protein